ncbi:hypothetical protein TNCV_4279271 [Trichonephila clavipes]|nr:hypothetical protein TNCV_4279271 [Trichonephila clavipes]
MSHSQEPRCRPSSHYLSSPPPPFTTSTPKIPLQRDDVLEQKYIHFYSTERTPSFSPLPIVCSREATITTVCERGRRSRRIRINPESGTRSKAPDLREGCV